jgi:hypothetical protein
MAQPIRVVFRSKGGSLLRRASKEAQAQSQQVQMQIGRKWKEDPGIRFICYYLSYGAGLDGYSHHYVFEVDDLSKVDEMNQDIWTSQDLLMDEFSFEIAFANPEIDGFFKG